MNPTLALVGLVQIARQLNLSEIFNRACRAYFIKEETKPKMKEEKKHFRDYPHNLHFCSF